MAATADYFIVFTSLLSLIAEQIDETDGLILLISHEIRQIRNEYFMQK
jgi:hypothetical protein